ncbi:signal peptidase I [Paucibacter sp. APW11]|uniref:Signal peptidase I n=1 Tax=Roseateles aquae TaxID=3077235 RepID=A0ABU3PHE1_9BURK|nr:signal peptidase I [Paucibacter sp. APW11]MDT9001835.1 signal peptidase I [Paucibacter sp. APW11]
MKNWFKHNRGFLLFLLCFGFFRTAVADWNPIPSGSMRPNLLEGDVVFVNRLAYDFKLPLTDHIIAPLADPQRGDIVTFSSPRDGTRLIKRLIAVPGDTVEMRDGRLLINGESAQYDDVQEKPEPLEPFGSVKALQMTEKLGALEHRMQRLEGVRSISSFEPVVIPPGQYLMLGDNRDNSADSRYIGLVPRQLLIGRAVRILASADIKGDWLPRLGRFGQKLQ